MSVPDILALMRVYGTVTTTLDGRVLSFGVPHVYNPPFPRLRRELARAVFGERFFSLTASTDSR